MIKDRAITKHVVAIVMALIMLIMLPVNAFASAVGDTGYYYFEQYGFYKRTGYLNSSETKYTLNQSFVASRGGLRNFLNFLCHDLEGNLTSYSQYIFTENPSDKIIMSFLDANNDFYVVVCQPDTNFKIYYDESSHKLYFYGMLPNPYRSLRYKASNGSYNSALQRTTYNWQWNVSTNGTNTNASRSFNLSNVYELGYLYYDIYNLDGSVYETADESNLDSEAGRISRPDDSETDSFSDVTDSFSPYYDDSMNDSEPPFRSPTETYDEYNGELIVWGIGIIENWLRDIYRMFVEYYNRFVVYAVSLRSYFVTLSHNFSISLSNSTNTLVSYFNSVINRMNYLTDRLITAVHMLNNTEISQTSRIVNAIEALDLSGSGSSSGGSTTVNVDMSTTNQKLDTINGSIQSVGSALSALSGTLTSAINSVVNVSNGVFTAGNNFANGLVQVIAEGTNNRLRGLLIPNTENLNNIVEENVPAVSQVQHAFSYEGDDIDTQFAYSFKLFDDDFAYADDLSDMPNEYQFGIGDIPPGLRQGIYDATTLIAYVLRFFLIIKIFFKTFNIKISSEGDD